MAIEWRLDQIRLFIKTRRLKVLQKAWRRRAATRAVACKKLQKLFRGVRTRWTFAKALEQMRARLGDIRAEKLVENQHICDKDMGEIRAVLGCSRLWPEGITGLHPVDEQSIFTKVSLKLKSTIRRFFLRFSVELVSDPKKAFKMTKPQFLKAIKTVTNR